MSERKTLTAPVEWKAADHGELSGYASVFNNVDLDGDVVRPGAFTRTLADWARAKAPLPLTSDHQLDSGGVIGSVVHAEEDSYGLRIRARFSSVAKAQDIRTKMIEGHLRGLSFIYEAIRHHRGQKDGQPVRFLDELRLYETTVSPAPRNLLALATAKGGPADPADIDEDRRQLEELEAWALAATTADTLGGLLDNPDAMAHAARVMVGAKAQTDLAELTRWADSLPPRPPDNPQAEAAERDRARWAKANADSYRLREAMARPGCQHRSCMPGRCVYA
jgi:HK97 family phage prohead protease